jgi:hypothetical protein
LSFSDYVRNVSIALGLTLVIWTRLRSYRYRRYVVPLRMLPGLLTMHSRLQSLPLRHASTTGKLSSARPHNSIQMSSAGSTSCGSSLSKSPPGTSKKISIELVVECFHKPMTDGLNDNKKNRPAVAGEFHRSFLPASVLLSIPSLHYTDIYSFRFFLCRDSNALACIAGSAVSSGSAIGTSGQKSGAFAVSQGGLCIPVVVSFVGVLLVPWCSKAHMDLGLGDVKMPTRRRKRDAR